MTESSLYDLLQDMLMLQAEVFTCISEDVCHKVLAMDCVGKQSKPREGGRGERENGHQCTSLGSYL